MLGERSFSRREVLRTCAIGLLASPLATLAGCEKRAPRSFVEPAGAPYDGTDEQLLEEIQRATFHFFWDEASQKTGQVKDRALANLRIITALKCRCSAGLRYLTRYCTPKRTRTRVSASAIRAGWRPAGPDGDGP